MGLKPGLTVLYEAFLIYKSHYSPVMADSHALWDNKLKHVSEEFTEMITL